MTHVYYNPTTYTYHRENAPPICGKVVLRAKVMELRPLDGLPRAARRCWRCWPTHPGASNVRVNMPTEPEA